MKRAAIITAIVACVVCLVALAAVAPRCDGAPPGIKIGDIMLMGGCK